MAKISDPANVRLRQSILFTTEILAEHPVEAGLPLDSIAWLEVR